MAQSKSVSFGPRAERRSQDPAEASPNDRSSETPELRGTGSFMSNLRRLSIFRLFSNKALASAVAGNNDLFNVIPAILRSSCGIKEERVPDLSGRVKKTQDHPMVHGTYADIYKGKYKSTQVAIKVIKGNRPHNTMQRRFRREALSCYCFRHDNIVEILGVVKEGEFGNESAMILPWYNHGDAAKYLSETPRPISERFDLFRDVTCGLQYLHNLDPKIVHGDLKPGNILIDDNGNARLCDFGLLSIIRDINKHPDHTQLTTTTGYSGTIRYAAPELLEEKTDPTSSGEPAFTTASDMYALACVGYEFVYSQLPFARVTNQATAKYVIQRAVLEKGESPASRPEDILDTVKDLWEIVFETCWMKDPGLRPEIDVVQVFLEENRDKLILELDR